MAPGWQIAVCLKENKDFFGAPIRDETGSTTDQAFDVFNYAWQMSMPPWLSNRGFIGGSSIVEAVARLDPSMVEGRIVDALLGRTNRYGEPEEDAWSSVAYLAGLNVKPIGKNERSIQIRRMVKDERDLRSKITSARKDKSTSKSQKNKIINELTRRVDKAREERREFAKESS